jgi:hypothetical protein
MRNGLSFDVEEHFHALNLRRAAPADSWDRHERRAAASTRTVLRILADRGVSATFYFLGWVAERDKALVREVHDLGHEVGSHGMSHRMAARRGTASGCWRTSSRRRSRASALRRSR